ncbi:MAG TPA: hypothetical protein VMU24_09630 [Candidatus Acidoferrales bacterium]|nr:hypothetical protein [Candidatus Acidoferrales bacterium]
MIFGFNTDIRVGENVVHVQSEARSQEHVLETQVFLHGHCIGKRVVPYEPERDEAVQERLRAQHKWIIEAARDGFLEDALNLTSPISELTNSQQAREQKSTEDMAAYAHAIVEEQTAAETPVPAAAPSSHPERPQSVPVTEVEKPKPPQEKFNPNLRIEFLGAPRIERGIVVLQFCIFIGLHSAPDVKIHASWSDEPERVVARSASGSDGVGTIRVPYSSAAETTTLSITAKTEEGIARKRFRIRFETH